MDKPLYQSSEYVFDFIFLILVMVFSIWAIVLLLGNVFLKAILIILSLMIVGLYGYFNVSRIEVFKSRILIVYPLRFFGQQMITIDIKEIRSIKYYSYKLNNPSNLQFFLRKKGRGSLRSFNVTIPEEKAVKLIDWYKMSGIDILNDPRTEIPHRK